MGYFWSKVAVDVETGCWEWTAAKAKNGYAQFHFDQQTGYAHRFAYVTLVGPIPDGLDIDHLCRNRGCVNPAHLEPVTRSVNLRRGDGPRCARERAARITHCPQGHSYTGDNLYVNTSRPSPRRRCQACHAAEEQRRRARLKKERGSA